MGSEEIREVVYIGLSLLMTAAVILCAAGVLQLRDTYASSYNDQFKNISVVQEYGQFSDYNGKVVYGEDLITALAAHGGKDLRVYVDNLNGSDGEIYVPAGIHTDKSSEYPFDMDVDTLTDKVLVDKTYFVYLTFDAYELSEVKGAEYHDLGANPASNITGLHFIYCGEGRHDAAATTAECSCGGDVARYGVCTAPQVYSIVSAVPGFSL